MSPNTELAYWITPKSGPVRPLKTLHDANQAMLDDVPPAIRFAGHWLCARFLVQSAARSEGTQYLRPATDALFHALTAEGWMTRASLHRQAAEKKTQEERV